MKQIKFNGCKHLDLDKKKYPSCELKAFPGDFAAYWERDKRMLQVGDAQKVQFCALRGRLNTPTACLAGNPLCSEYSDVVHTVEIDEPKEDKPVSILTIEDSLVFANKLDIDKEMEIEYLHETSYCGVWINEEQAKEIISHLKKVFSI